MMDSTFSQPYVLAAMMYVGIAAGFVYDIMRSFLREKNKKWSIFGDALYFVILLLALIYVGYFSVRLQMRAFHYLGVAIGFGIYWCGIKTVKDKVTDAVRKRRNKL